MGLTHGGKLRSAGRVHAYYPKVIATPRTTALEYSPLVGAGTISPMVLGLYLSFLPYFSICRHPLLYGGSTVVLCVPSG